MGIATDHSLPQAGMASAPETSTEHAQRVDLFIFAMVGVAAAMSWARILPRINGIDVLAVTAVLGGGYPVFREALENLIQTNDDGTSMTIALAAALANRRTCL